MPKQMLINVTHSEESRVAIVADRVLESFEIESLSREHLKGNIYKGVVHRIHPALEAAFVDIGAERDAFLPLDEICFRNLAKLPPAAPADNGKKPRRRIRDLLSPGEEILVQIAKGQFANKPPTLTTFYSLPGRYLVLLPGSDDTGISRRIEGEERHRLRHLIESLNPPDGFGIIVRTAAGLDEDTGELSRDLGYLQRLWSSIQAAAAQKRAPALVYREQDIVLRTIRDLFTPDIDEIHVDNEEVFLRAREFLRDVMPGKEHVLRCYRGEQPIFSAFDLEAQIETVFKRRVGLKSGGTIVIDGTEALTAVDVNSGGSVRGPNPEETAFRTNLEAAAEVARQLRLRDIGGLIVVDFIDMREPRHVHEVEQTLRAGMRPDKARHEIGRISRFGLLEISRQRLRPAAMASTYASCPMCEGHGAVRTTESAALVALRKIHNRVALGDVAALRAALPPAVALYLLNQKRDELARLEQHYATRLHVELADRLMPHQIELQVRERLATERPVAVAPGAVAANDAPATTDTNGAPASDAGGAKKRRRRRGRKRGSGLRAATAIAEGLAALGGVAPAPYEEHPAAAAPADGTEAEWEPADDADELAAPDELSGADELDESAEYPPADHALDVEPPTEGLEPRNTEAIDDTPPPTDTTGHASSATQSTPLSAGRFIPNIHESAVSSAVSAPDAAVPPDTNSGVDSPKRPSLRGRTRRGGWQRTRTTPELATGSHPDELSNESPQPLRDSGAPPVPRSSVNEPELPPPATDGNTAAPPAASPRRRASTGRRPRSRAATAADLQAAQGAPDAGGAPPKSRTRAGSGRRTESGDSGKTAADTPRNQRGRPRSKT
ncbi:MAG: Rne/Rng family ribonuclease [Candidatus Binatia bacterium]